MTIHVFVSSTWLDLQPERQAIEVAIHRLRETKYVGMEYFGSRDETTQTTSLDEVDRSQLYIGIFGGRYGSGITEQEYRRAHALQLPCFPYFKAEVSISTAERETDPDKVAKLEALKQALRREHTVTTFNTPDQLAARVTADLHRWLFDLYLPERLEQAARGELEHQDALQLLSEVKDWTEIPSNLQNKLRSVGFVLTSDKGSIAIGRDLTDSVIVKGSGDIIAPGDVTMMGDGNVIGNKNRVRIAKKTKTTQGATLNDFTVLIAQMRELLQLSDLSKTDRETIETNLKTVEREAEKEKPRLKFIVSSLSSIKSLVESTEGIGSAAAKLMPKLIEAVGFARQLFP